MIVKIKARILKITKDDMQTCSTRCILAELVDEKYKQRYHIAWAEVPKVAAFPELNHSKIQETFCDAWEKCNEGDDVWICHPLDGGIDYIEPL